MSRKIGRPEWQLQPEDIFSAKKWINKKIAISELTPPAAKAYHKLSDDDPNDAKRINIFIHDFLTGTQQNKLRTSLRQGRWRRQSGGNFVTIKITRKNYERLQRMSAQWPSPSFFLEKSLIAIAWRQFSSQNKFLLRTKQIDQLDDLVQQEEATRNAEWAAEDTARKEKKRAAGRRRKIKENARKARLKNNQ